MNRFDKPLEKIGTVLGGTTLLLALAFTILGNNVLLGWLFAIAGLIAIGFMLASQLAYMKRHVHTSVVKEIWLVQRPVRAESGLTFRDVSANEPVVAMMRLQSKGTYNLGALEEIDEQVRIGDTVVVNRSWDEKARCWRGLIRAVAPAEKPAPKGDEKTA